MSVGTFSLPGLLRGQILSVLRKLFQGDRGGITCDLAALARERRGAAGCFGQGLSGAIASSVFDLGFPQ